MKGELVIIVISMILVLGIAYGIFNTQDYGISNTQGNMIGVTGSAMLKDSLDNSDSAEDDEIISNSIIVTEEQALNSLIESEQIIEKMIENDFPISFMEDTVLIAEKVFEQAQYAEILRGEVNSSKAEKLEAQNKLELIDWEEINYGDVIFYTAVFSTFKVSFIISLRKSKVTDIMYIF